MSLIVDKIRQFSEFYSWAHSVSDHRVKNWFLMDGYAPTLILTGLYLAAVYFGPQFMKRRQPFGLKVPLVLYNFILVIINFHICSQILYHSSLLGYSYRCQMVSYTDDVHEIQIAKAIWWFYFSKLVEMLDTIFFILRRKDNQVSFLHVYHHATMFPIWYIGVKWVAGGQSFFGAMINSFVHVIMYMYYGIAAIGPQYQKYLWWKRYLTKLQLFQFFIGVVYAGQAIFNGCHFPMWTHFAGIAYGITIIVLFANFYFHAYIAHRSVPKREKQVQFVAGITHAMQSIVMRCRYPMWMQWSLVFYAFSVMLFFVNFYYHTYVKTHCQKGKPKSAAPHMNGQVKVNGDALKDETSVEPKKMM